MGYRLIVLPLLLVSSYLQPGTSFALVKTTSTCKFKHATSNPTAYHSWGDLGIRRPTPAGGGAAGAAAAGAAATAMRVPWRHQANPYNVQHRLQVLNMPATEVEVSDMDFEPEISPGRALAEHEPQVQAFEAWTERAGCRGASSGSKLLHADFDGLRGLMTEGTVKPWQAVATVPASLFLEEFESAATAVASTSLPPPEPISPKAWQQCPWWVRLGVRLLIEKNAGKESRLHDYVGILPSQGETGAPINWSAEQLDRLHYPRLLSQIKLQRRLFNGAYELVPVEAHYSGQCRPKDFVESENTARAVMSSDRSMLNFASRPLCKIVLIQVRLYLVHYFRKYDYATKVLHKHDYNTLDSRVCAFPVRSRRCNQSRYANKVVAYFLSPDSPYYQVVQRTFFAPSP